MKLKLTLVLACAMAVIGLLPASASASPAAVLAPGVQQAAGANSCNVSVMHGNFGVSFSQFSYQPDFVPPELNECNTSGTYVVSYSLTTGNENPNSTKKWAEERCYITSNATFPDFGDGACNRWNTSPQWTQANNNDSTIVGTQMHLCGDVILCESVGDASFNPRYAAASPSLAHGEQTTLTKDGCSVTFMHGDFGSAAFAQMKYQPGACDQDQSFVELASIDSVGKLHHQRCLLNGSFSGSGSCPTWDENNHQDHWRQALQPDHKIVGSTVRLCSDNIEDHCDEFYQTGF